MTRPHEVTVHRAEGRRWWQCDCGWQGQPYTYDDPSKPAEAIRHTISEEDAMRTGAEPHRLQ